jgi:hypothetical protein
MNYYADGGQAMAAKELPPSQIITDDLERKASLEEVQQTIEYFDKANKEGKLFILQENNTIVVLVSVGEAIAEAHLYSVDTPIVMARSMKVMLDELKRSHIKRIYSNVDEDTPKILALMKRFGTDIQESDNPNYVWMADVTQGANYG